MTTAVAEPISSDPPSPSKRKRDEADVPVAETPPSDPRKKQREKEEDPPSTPKKTEGDESPPSPKKGKEDTDDVEEPLTQIEPELSPAESSAVENDDPEEK